MTAPHAVRLFGRLRQWALQRIPVQRDAVSRPHSSDLATLVLPSIIGQPVPEGLVIAAMIAAGIPTWRAGATPHARFGMSWGDPVVRDWRAEHGAAADPGLMIGQPRFGAPAPAQRPAPGWPDDDRIAAAEAIAGALGGEVLAGGIVLLAPRRIIRRRPCVCSD